MAGIGGVQAFDVGEQYENIGLHEMRQERCDVVVVAEPDLVVRDGIVLVDHRYTAEFEQTLERFARVQILLSVHEVVRHQQHLRGHQGVACELGVVHLHESTLTSGRQRLQRSNIGRTSRQTQSRHAGRHRARGHQHHVVAGLPQLSDLTADVGDDGAIDHTERIGE